MTSRRFSFLTRGLAASSLATLLVACADQASTSLPPDLAPAAGGSRSLDATAALYDGLDPGDIRLADIAIQKALERTPSLSRSGWRSQSSVWGGTVTPLRTFRAAEGFFCREFEETVGQATVTRSATRVACRARDGRWLPASLNDPS